MSTTAGPLAIGAIAALFLAASLNASTQPQPSIQSQAFDWKLAIAILSLLVSLVAAASTAYVNGRMKKFEISAGFNTKRLEHLVVFRKKVVLSPEERSEQNALIFKMQSGHDVAQSVIDDYFQRIQMRLVKNLDHYRNNLNLFDRDTRRVLDPLERKARALASQHKPKEFAEAVARFSDVFEKAIDSNIEQITDTFA